MGLTNTAYQGKLKESTRSKKRAFFCTLEGIPRSDNIHALPDIDTLDSLNRNNELLTIVF